MSHPHGPQHAQQYPPQGYQQQPGYGPGPGYGPPQGAPGYGYRPEPKNGLGLSALIVGGVGILFGLVPLTFWVAGPLALTSIALGLAGLARVRRGTATNKGVSAVGLTLGLVAAALSIWGAVTFFTALDKLGNDLGKIGDRASQSAAELSRCLDEAQGDPKALEKCTK